MPLPSINITFKTLGITAISRSQKGVVALILQDSRETGGHALTGAGEIPADWSAENRDYVTRAFLGYVTPPRKVLVYVLDNSDADQPVNINEALDYFAMQEFDYLAGYPGLESADAGAIVSWIKSQRLSDHMVKAVVPGVKADSEAVVNFTTGGIETGSGTYSAAEYCSRIAGLIAGTPMTISCTYAPLGEVTDVERKDKETLDAAIDAGEFVLFHDGEKVKVGRGVNSLVTTTQDKGAAFQKIKLVETVDMIKNDIRITAQDHYIGKYANSYDNKCLLIMAIKGYFEELERAGILARDSSAVEIDLEAQEGYLRSNGIDTGSMSEQEIKEAGTGSNVFLRATISILDAIEDIDLAITI